MAIIRILAIALAGSSLAAVPAQAGSLLGGGAVGCLCNAVGGLLGSGVPSVPSIGNPGSTVSGVVNRATGSGLSRNGSISANVSNSVNGALGVTTSRSIDRRHGAVNGNVGLAGTVSSVSNAALGAQGLGKNVGLAGSSSTSGSINKQIGLGLNGVGTNHVHSLAGQVAGSVGAVVSKTHSTGPGTQGSLTATVNSAANAALAVTKSHGGSAGGQPGSSSLTATLGNTANGALAVTKNHGGASNGNSGPGLPNGIQIINGVPCGPDGKPLTGPDAAAVMALLNHGGGSSNAGGSSNGTGGSAGSNGSHGSQSVSSSNAGSHSRERDTADRKDLWWPPRAEQQSDSGRLNDH